MRASPSLSQLWQPHSRLCHLCRACEQQRSCSPSFRRKELHAPCHRRRCRGSPSAANQIRGHRHRRARLSIHSGQRRLHAHEPRSCSRHSGEARDRLWRGGSRPRISSQLTAVHTLYAWPCPYPALGDGGGIPARQAQPQGADRWLSALCLLFNVTALHVSKQTTTSCTPGRCQSRGPTVASGAAPAAAAPPRTALWAVAWTTRAHPRGRADAAARASAPAECLRGAAASSAPRSTR